MKLPNFNATPAPGFQQHYASQPGMRDGAMIQPSGILDVFKTIGSTILDKLPCVLSAAGSKGVGCLTTCGPNPACLAACAGPSLVTSILGCL